jgi:hypothetical protein
VADAERIRKAIWQADKVAYAKNFDLFTNNGKRDALGPEYEQAVDRQELCSGIVDEQVPILNWLQDWVDTAKHHVTFDQINKKALAEDKILAIYRQYMEPLVMVALGGGLFGGRRAPAAETPPPPKVTEEARPVAASPKPAEPAPPPLGKRPPVPRPLEGGRGGDRARSVKSAAAQPPQTIKGNPSGPLGPRKPDTNPMGRDIPSLGENQNADALNRSRGVTVQSPELLPEFKEKLEAAKPRTDWIPPRIRTTWCKGPIVSGE